MTTSSPAKIVEDCKVGVRTSTVVLKELCGTGAGSMLLLVLLRAHAAGRPLKHRNRRFFGRYAIVKHKIGLKVLGGSLADVLFEE